MSSSFLRSASANRSGSSPVCRCTAIRYRGSTTPETPNLGTIDATEDQRPGLGFAGLERLRRFVEAGGVLVAVEDTARLLIANGLTPGVRVTEADDLKVSGSILDARFPPDAFAGHRRLQRPPLGLQRRGDELRALPLGERRLRRADDTAGRPTGRGSKTDIDTPQGRAFPAAAKAPKAERWESLPLTSEQTRRNPNVIPGRCCRARWCASATPNDLLVSGLLDHGGDLARRAAVVDAPLGKGHILLFAINPIWRGSTIGSHPLVWNAILACDRLTPAPR